MTSSTSCGAPSLRLADHSLDLLQLLHQVRLRRQPARGVDDDDVAAARLAGDDGVEGHRGRIAALLADDLDLVALGPGDELLARGGAEGVGGGEQHLLVDRRGGGRACRSLVVLPAPLTPTTIITVGVARSTSIGFSSGASNSVSSSRRAALSSPASPIRLRRARSRNWAMSHSVVAWPASLVSSAVSSSS